MSKKQRLELMWIGKGEKDNPRLEPRILIEDPERSYGDKDTENILIHGDNLLALKALEQDYAGKVKCIYIDPPFNTGNAFEYYDDGLEHSIWLNLMNMRFKVLHSLLRSDGIIFVHLDGTEMAYCKVLLDEIFGRSNYLNTISMTTNDPSGFKATGAKVFSTANYLLIYAKDKTFQSLKKVFIPKEYDKSYSKFLLNPDEHFSKWKYCSLNDLIAKKYGYAKVSEAKKKLGDEFDARVEEFALSNPEQVFQCAAIGGGAAIKRKSTIELSKKTKDIFFQYDNEDIDDFYILNGRQVLFYHKRFVDIDGKKVPAEVITDIWVDISWNGIASEGSVEFKNGKKPEGLIRRIIEMATDNQDIVLDSFLGSGTTAAVAHKMGRKWIGVELGEHCNTHCVPRLQKVIDGTDQGGISKAVDWQGGGGFRYYTLAPSLLKKDSNDRWVISEEYNAEQLAAAMAKQEGFKYYPDETVYWKQGYSTETDFIYTTTQFLTVDIIDKIHEEMKPEESLLITCKAFQDACVKRHSNITVKKIPHVLLGRCEFGKDDYSLNIINVPVVDAEDEEEEDC